jgi:DNA replication protein DnaC
MRGFLRSGGIRTARGCDTGGMAEVCGICGGAGMRVVERAGGLRVAEPCACRVARKTERMIAEARIPQRYQHCVLDSFETQESFAKKVPNRSLEAALLMARNFVRGYPAETDGQGLLLTGSIGVGKTHLAVGILQALVTERGARGLFYDYRDLLKQVQNSYGRNVETSEREVLAPVFEAEVLVLDELGAAKPTDWVWDTVAHILNTRYNDRRTTIITTNYPNLPPLGVESAGAGSGSSSAARAAMREESLGDRITERMRSRLQEMCVVVEINGSDRRQGLKRARFA